MRQIDSGKLKTPGGTRTHTERLGNARTVHYTTEVYTFETVLIMGLEPTIKAFRELGFTIKLYKQKKPPLVGGGLKLCSQ